MAIKMSGKPAKKRDEISYEVKEKCGVISTRGKYTLELRLMSWNGREEKYDLRTWTVDENGEEKCGKGVSLSGEELVELGNLINKMNADA